MVVPACSDSWNHVPLPDKHIELKADWRFTEVEFRQMSRGFVPEIMEDKWFIFFEAGWFNFHRSWTGFCIYRMKIEREGSTYRSSQLFVNRDPDQYLSTDDSYDLKLLRHLIDRQLLGRDSTAPIPDGLPVKIDNALYRHHIVGHDRCSDELGMDSA